MERKDKEEKSNEGASSRSDALMKRLEKIHVPPLKTQGIKTRLVNWILGQVSLSSIQGRWIEPFMGSGIVGFNLRPYRAVFADINPHIIHFYRALQERRITSQGIRDYLEKEGSLLAERGSEHYYLVRDRFNTSGNPLDFLFLNRSCFNGLIRFNQQAQFNTPFGHKPQRFRRAYITKIVNQVKYVENVMQGLDWTFLTQDFRKTIADATKEDVIYCDPPYIGRHANYFDSWSEADEQELFELLSSFEGKFLLSTWYKNQFRKNPYVDKFWGRFKVRTRNHFYHVGGKEINRRPIVEALITNF